MVINAFFAPFDLNFTEEKNEKSYLIFTSDFKGDIKVFSSIFIE
jgi:hypothetical protein